MSYEPPVRLLGTVFEESHGSSTAAAIIGHPGFHFTIMQLIPSAMSQVAKPLKYDSYRHDHQCYTPPPPPKQSPQLLGDLLPGLCKCPHSVNQGEWEVLLQT